MPFKIKFFIFSPHHTKLFHKWGPPPLCVKRACASRAPIVRPCNNVVYLFFPRIASSIHWVLSGEIRERIRKKIILWNYKIQNFHNHSNKLLLFSDEEGYGKYLDLHECYDKFINLKVSISSFLPACLYLCRAGIISGVTFFSNNFTETKLYST